MEFEFFIDTLGEPKSQFSMGHEVFAHCLNEQYQHENEVSELVMALQKAIQSQQFQSLIGRFYSIDIHPDEVIIKDNSINALDEFDSLDDDALSDFAFESSCGLEDFIEMIEQWQCFVKEC